MKALSLSRPHLIVMVGIPGAGKSFFADHFAETFKAPFINRGALELELNAHHGKLGHSVDVLVDIMLRELVKTNQTIVYEGHSATRAERLALSKKAIKAGYTPLFIWVQTESVEASRRATKRTAKNTHLTMHEFDNAISHFDVPLASEHAIVISGKHTYTSQLKIVLKHLASSQQSKPTTQVSVTTPPVEPKRSSDRTVRNIFIR